MTFIVSFLMSPRRLDFPVSYRVLLPLRPLERIIGIFGRDGEECLASCRIIALCSFQVHRAGYIFFMCMTVSHQSLDNIPSLVELTFAPDAFAGAPWWVMKERKMSSVEASKH